MTEGVFLFPFTCLAVTLAKVEFNSPLKGGIYLSFPCKRESSKIKLKKQIKY